MRQLRSPGPPLQCDHFLVLCCLHPIFHEASKIRWRRVPHLLLVKVRCAAAAAGPRISGTANILLLLPYKLLLLLPAILLLLLVLVLLYEYYC